MPNKRSLLAGGAITAALAILAVGAATAGNPGRETVTAAAEQPLPAGAMAVQAFDQFYYVGSEQVGSWALKTSDGIILFDTMNDAGDARRIIVPGLRKLGLDPAHIKYIVIGQSHGDHTGGARYLQETFGAKVMMSARDWSDLGGGGRAGDGVDGAPRRDLTATDGQKLTLGGTTITIYETPGHTSGTISYLIPVTDQGRPHLIGMLGGTGLPGGAALRQMRESYARFIGIATDAKADAVVNAHPFVDKTLEKAPRALRRGPSDPNPWVLGSDGYAREMRAFLAEVDSALGGRRN